MMSIQPLKAGDVAPDFSLLDQDEQAIQLSDFKGKRVLIYFYPKAMTPGCTAQACSLRDHLTDFNAFDVKILGISTDLPEKLAKFTDRDLLNFPLLSDPDHKVCSAYGIWGEKTFMGKTYEGIHRVSFLIDAEGKIEHVFTDFKTSNHDQVILDYLKSH